MQEPIALQPEKTALVIIDLQKGIVSFPAEPSKAEDVIARAAGLAEAFRAKGGTVVFVRVTGSEDGKDMLRPDADEAMTRSGPPAPDWAEIIPELKRQSGEIVITKRQWGAFYGTELDLQLRRRGIDTIVLCGIATNYGVESTARDAYERGYRLVFAEDAMASRTAADHEFPVKRIFPRIGRVRPTADIIAALSA